jgi:hypothetical protein
MIMFGTLSAVHGHHVTIACFWLGLRGQHSFGMTANLRGCAVERLEAFSDFFHPYWKGPDRPLRGPSRPQVRTDAGHVAAPGTALTIGEWRGVFAVALALFALLWKIRVEEARMLNVFPEYQHYQDETWTLIPFIF